ncbi:SDR family NAD(P)-dependent oxidoreductase [Actinomadura fulvescens]|uniref:SDR family oxidoreductase n=1 Tax=Actinomadura fulvescens TaxID=46160 RepID=A0ABP6D6E2_9ACTN
MADPAHTAAITGGARGLGRAIAQSFIARGHTVVIGDLDLAAAEETAGRLGRRCHAVPLDVTDPASTDAFLHAARAHMGDLDVLVNNAGILPTGRLTDQRADMLQRATAVNLTGPIYASRAVLPGLLQRGGGHLITVASATAVKPLAGLAAYSAAKAGLLAFNEALRRELRRHHRGHPTLGGTVHVSTVLPYLCATRAGSGLRAQPGFSPVAPATVGNAVAALADRPRATLYLPRRLRLLPWLAHVPTTLRDLLDDWMRTDEITLNADLDQRAAYLDELHSHLPAPARRQVPSRHDRAG